MDAHLYRRARGLAPLAQLAAGILASQIASPLLADEPPALFPSHATIQVGDEPIGRSPYEDWTDQGMQPLPDRQARQDDITIWQANLINAAYGGYGWREDEHYCAGCPQGIRKRATPSNTHHYCGYYVGGGVPCFGEGRYFDEGTWGWDYLGITFPKKVGLQWTHWRYQGGTGAYKTDGPHIPHH
ncbi:MAG: hypothetical protein SFU86_15295 [Pirellulaceae bacterium]|nr:hypothetical protein [Pirellulaceae bacterium]